MAAKSTGIDMERLLRHCHARYAAVTPLHCIFTFGPRANPFPPKNYGRGTLHVIVSAFYRRKPWLRHCVIDRLMLRRQLRFRMLMCVIFAASACCQCELEDVTTVMLRAYKVGQYNSEPLLDSQQIVLNVCK